MSSRSKTFPNAEKKSFVSFFEPLFRGIKQTSTPQPEDDCIVITHPNGQRAPADTYQHMPRKAANGPYMPVPLQPPPIVPWQSPSASSPSLPSPVIPPYQYSQLIFAPPPVQAIPANIPSLSFPETPPHQMLQPGRARNSRSASRRRSARSGGTELHSATRESIAVPVAAPVLQVVPHPGPVLHVPAAVPRAKASDSKASKRSHSSKQAAPVKSQIPLVVSAKTAEPSLHPAARNQKMHGDVVQPSRQDNQTLLKPGKREPKPPSPEYLATPLSDNPLGLTGMVPLSEEYSAPQGNDAITAVSRSRTRQVPAIQDPVGQVKERRKERDSSGRKSHYHSSRRGHRSSAFESSNATIVAASNPPSHHSMTRNANRSPTYAASIKSSQLSEIMCLVENPHTDLCNPIRLMSPESITSARVPRSLRTSYTD